MPYFLSQENLSVNKITEIAPPESGHILLSHRAKKGEKVKLQGSDGRRFLAEIIKADRKSLKLKPIQELPVPEESKVFITLFQSIVSEKALDFIFQKGTELGLGKIVLFNSANTATKLTADQFAKKQERWKRILIEAAKQSERAKWPDLESVLNVDRVMEKMRSMDKVLLADIGGKNFLPEVLNIQTQPTHLGLVIGPEGGLTAQEAVLLKSLSNVEVVSLGPILLRAETAALASLVICRAALY